MREIPFIIANAFADQPFSGNQCAVCITQEWLVDAEMRALAAEFATSASAFVVPVDDSFAIRWFAPSGREIELCGHGTIAAAHVLFETTVHSGDTLILRTERTSLLVGRSDPEVWMTMPAGAVESVADPSILAKALGGRIPPRAWKGRDYVAVFDDASTVQALSPDRDALRQIDAYALVVTAPGGPDDEADYVARFFKSDRPDCEDPVNGASQAFAAPLWARLLQRTELRVRQLSKRGGRMRCRVDEDGVTVSARAFSAMRGKVYLTSVG
ncbi:MAG: PhzF family phenazine biosynthesis protein [Gemmatimonadaceae bacterium]